MGWGGGKGWGGGREGETLTWMGEGKEMGKGKEIEGKSKGNCYIPHESLALVGQKVLDVGTASEDSLQIHPATLYIDPHIKQGIDPVQPVLPSQCFVLKHLVVWRQLHGRDRVDVLLDLCEQVVPASDDAALVLVVYQVQFVCLP